MSADNKEYTTTEYWNNRVRTEKHNLKDLIFNDDHRNQMWNNVDKLLSVYKEYSVADIGCGYGRFAKHFDNYTGFDFCDEMLKLAQEQNPTKNFIKARCLDPLPAKYDIIFECNCCHSFQVSREDFINYYKQFANVAVICIEKTGVMIEWLYSKTDKELNLK